MIDILAPKYGYDPSDIEIIEIGAKPGEKLYYYNPKYTGL